MSDLDLTDPYDPDRFKKPEEPAPAPGPAEEPAPAPFRALSPAEELAAAPPPEPKASARPAPLPPPAPPEDPAAAAPEASGSGPTPWKAAASSVPKLRQQPAPLPEPAAGEEGFPGFAQDAIPGRAGTASPDAAPHTSPLTAELPWWEASLERVRALPRSVVIGGGAALLLAVMLFTFLRPHGDASVPLARILQHPEAFDGRTVSVQGKAGETFTVGGNFVFDLRQGRDTIVVYSSRHPALHERVRATGTVSIGYLDGAPRVALFEQSQTP